MRVNLAVQYLMLASHIGMQAASWTALKNPMPGGGPFDTLLLTDGTDMLLTQDQQHWVRLTPDKQGSYVNGDWTTTPGSVMGISRGAHTNQMLPSGKVWVLGGESSGIAGATPLNGTAEVFDPATNRWSAISPYPPIAGTCTIAKTFGGTILKGSPVISEIAVPNSGWQPGWGVTGTGIPAGTVIATVDSPTQIHLSSNATSSGGFAFSLGVQTTGTTAQGSNVITGIGSTAGYQTGWVVSGSTIPSGATISKLISATSIQISQNATAASTALTINFAVNFAFNDVPCFGDDPSMLLAGGKILAGNIFTPKTYLYDIASDTWSEGSSKVYKDSSDEEAWAKLSDGRILTYDREPGSSLSATGNFTFIGVNGYAELYDPVANKWSGITPADGSAKGVLPFLGDDMGPVVRLFDDRMLVLGGNGHTALYTPSTNTWAAGPDMLGDLGGLPYLFTTDDAPAATLPNGHVIFAADAGNPIILSASVAVGSPLVSDISTTAQLQPGWKVSGAGIAAGTIIKSIDSISQITLSASAAASSRGSALTFGGAYSPPTRLFDFDPTTNLLSPVSPPSPDPRANTSSSFYYHMLMLPTGQVLFNTEASSQMWIYTPDGSVDPTLLPTIYTVSSKSAGQFTLTGSQLTGQSAGSAYGDEFNSDTNYPIISLTDAVGKVYYARTANWSYIGVAGGSEPQTVDFTLNPITPPGTFTLRVTGAGLVSKPATVSVSSDLSKVSLVSTVTPVVSLVQDAESTRRSIVSGQWVAIYGSGLAYTTRTWNDGDFTGGVKAGAPLPTLLSGVSVTIGGKAAAVYFVSPSQINVLSPSGLPIGPAAVVVTVYGVPGSASMVNVVQASPSFFYYAAGTGFYPAAVHLSGALVGDPAISGATVAAAHPGEVIEVFANGLGSSPGDVVVSTTAFTQPITASAGSFPLTVLGAALVSSGQFQINVQLPANIPAGSYPMTLTVPNGLTSTSGVTITLPVAP